MSYYRIKESLSKEENLELAKQYSESAKSLVNEFNEILKKANKQFPVSSFGMSKSKLEKEQSLQKTYERLQTASWSYNNIKSTYETRERMIKEKEEKAQKEQANIELNQRKVETLNKAIKFLLENGKIFGEEFTTENAHSVANELAFQLEINRREAQIGKEYIDFSGQNCKEECAGWNPSERRCQCGNRRVTWTEGYYSTFENMEIYAEAW